MTRMY